MLEEVDAYFRFLRGLWPGLAGTIGLVLAPMIEYPAFASFDEGSLLAETTRVSHYEIVENYPKLEDGYLHVSESPGLGLGGFRTEGISRLQGLFDEELPV